MTTQTKIVTSRAPAKEAVKDASMVKQKEMMAAHYDRLTSAPETGDKVAATFVPGNLNELIMCFDLLNNLPEVNAIQNGLRRVSGSYVLEAEKIGHSEDVCTYVKSDIGMMAKGNIAPNGKKFPNPDVLLLSYTGCFTFMKWFELLREQYKCETIMLHTPYMGDGKITKNMIDYMVKQLKEEVIPTLERVSGVKFDIDRLREYLKKSTKAEDDLVRVLQSAKSKPSPIDAYFGGIYYIGPIFGAFRGTQDAVDYYKFLREEVEDRLAKGLGPVTPDGDMGKEKYRLVVEGTAQLHQLPPVLEDVLRRRRGRRRVELHQGRRRLRFRLPPRSRQTVGDAGRILPRRLHQPQPADAHRHAGQLHQRIRSGRAADQLDQELQQLLGRAIADDARGREAHRQTGRVRGIRPGRSALFLGGQHQEPSGELFPDGRSKTCRRGRGGLRRNA